MTCEVRRTPRRIYDQCVYKDCTTHRIKDNARLFRFPSAKDWRHDYWLQYTGNPRLKSWKPATLRNAGLCARHFNPNDISIRGSLRRDAFPLPFYKDENVVEDGNATGSSNLPGAGKASSTAKITNAPLSGKSSTFDIAEWDRDFDPKVIEPTRTYEKRARPANAVDKRIQPIRTYEKRTKPYYYDSDDDEVTWLRDERGLPETSSLVDTVHVTPTRVIPTVMNYAEISANELHRQNRYLRRNIARLTSNLAECRKKNTKITRQLHRMTERNALLRSKSKKKTVEEMLDERECVSPAARAMVKLQLHRKNAPFGDDEKDLALQLFCHSAPAYKRLLKAGCNFPSISAVRLWISEIETNPRTRTVFDPKRSANCDIDHSLGLIDQRSDAD